MDIVVCIKRVPDITEAELAINEKERDIEKKGLVFDLNEWDRYALEEAILLKEKFGGKVIAIMMSNEKEAEDSLRKCLAMGADEGIMLKDNAFGKSDAYATAKILSQAIKGLSFDLILTGVQASDDGSGSVGAILAELSGIPHATLVTKIELEGGKARVNQELEGGLEEIVEVKLPALLTIQTGINEPRYVSIMGVRRAAKKEIKFLGLKDIGLSEAEVGESGSKIKVRRAFLTPAGKEAKILKGKPDEISSQIVNILKGKGGVI